MTEKEDLLLSSYVAGAKDALDTIDNYLAEYMGIIKQMSASDFVYFLAIKMDKIREQLRKDGGMGHD